MKNSRETGEKLNTNTKYPKPKTKGQEEYLIAIADNDITICSGPAGSGKTALAVLTACSYLLDNRVEKIIVTRPLVGVAVRNLGALPGDVKEKTDPYLIPIYEEMAKYFGDRHHVERYIREGKIEFPPLELMRGRTFDNTFMILDESQNCTYEQLTMFLTRIGQNSKMIVNGDLDQTDLKNEFGFRRCSERLEKVKGIAVIELTDKDIVRNELIKNILAALK